MQKSKTSLFTVAIEQMPQIKKTLKGLATHFSKLLLFYIYYSISFETVKANWQEQL